MKTVVRYDQDDLVWGYRNERKSAEITKSGGSVWGGEGEDMDCQWNQKGEKELGVGKEGFKRWVAPRNTEPSIKGGKGHR